MASNLDLSVKVTAETDGAEKIDALNKSIDQVGEISSDSASKADRLSDATKTVGNTASDASHKIITLNNALGAISQLEGYAKQILDILSMGEAIQNLETRLKAVLPPTMSFVDAQQAIIEIAAKTHAPLTDIGNLYTQIASSAKTLGIAQTEVATLTELMSKGMSISGASSQAASAALQQFGQSLAKGKLEAEEFNSVNEAAPYIIDQLAIGLGVARDQLKGLVDTGSVGAREMVKALTAQAGAIDETYGKLGVNVAKASTDLQNSFSLFLSSMDKALGASQSVAGGLEFLAKNFEWVGAAIGGLVAAGLPLLIARMTAVEAGVTGVRAAVSALSGHPVVALAALAAGTAAVVAAQNDWFTSSDKLIKKLNEQGDILRSTSEKTLDKYVLDQQKVSATIDKEIESLNKDIEYWKSWGANLLATSSVKEEAAQKIADAEAKIKEKLDAKKEADDKANAAMERSISLHIQAGAAIDKALPSYTRIAQILDDVSKHNEVYAGSLVAQAKAQEDSAKIKADWLALAGDEVGAAKAEAEASRLAAETAQAENKAVKDKIALAEERLRQLQQLDPLNRAEIEKQGLLIQGLKNEAIASDSALKTAKARSDQMSVSAQITEDNSQKINQYTQEIDDLNTQIQEQISIQERAKKAAEDLASSEKAIADLEKERKGIVTDLNAVTDAMQGGWDKLAAEMTKVQQPGETLEQTLTRLQGSLSQVDSRISDTVAVGYSYKQAIDAGSEATKRQSELEYQRSGRIALLKDGIKDSSKAAADNVSIAQQSISIIDKQNKVEIDALKNKQQLLISAGKEKEAADVGIEIKKKETQAADDKLRAARNELGAAKEKAAADIKEIENSSLSRAEKDRQIALIKQKIEAQRLDVVSLAQQTDALKAQTSEDAKRNATLERMRTETEAARDLHGSFTSIGAVLREKYQQAGLSVEYFDEQLSKTARSARAGWETLHQLELGLNSVIEAQKQAGIAIGKFSEDVKKGSFTTQELTSWIQQASTAEHALEQAAKDAARATTSIAGPAHSSGMALQDMARISKADLDKLKSAIDEAKNALKAMEDQAKAALQSAQDELDQMNNNKVAIEERRYKALQEELKAKLDAAQKANDAKAVADIQEAMRIQQEIHDRKMKQIKDEQQAQQQASTDVGDHQVAIDNAVTDNRLKQADKVKTVALTNIDAVAEHQISSDIAEHNHKLNLIAKERRARFSDQNGVGPAIANPGLSPQEIDAIHNKAEQQQQLEQAAFDAAQKTKLEKLKAASEAQQQAEDALQKKAASEEFDRQKMLADARAKFAESERQMREAIAKQQAEADAKALADNQAAHDADIRWQVDNTARGIADIEAIKQAAEAAKKAVTGSTYRQEDDRVRTTSTTLSASDTAVGVSGITQATDISAIVSAFHAIAARPISVQVNGREIASSVVNELKTIQRSM